MGWLMEISEDGFEVLRLATDVLFAASGESRCPWAHLGFWQDGIGDFAFGVFPIFVVVVIHQVIDREVSRVVRHARAPRRHVGTWCEMWEFGRAWAACSELDRVAGFDTRSEVNLLCRFRCASGIESLWCIRTFNSTLGGGRFSCLPEDGSET